jgi:hypothetical protein
METTWTPADWETLAQRAGEPDRAHSAFLDYVRLGPGRSLRKLLARYRGQTEGEPRADFQPPTQRQATLEAWSTRWEWQARLTAFKAEQDTREQQRWEQRQREIREADWQTGTNLRTLAAQIFAQAPQFLKTSRKLIRGKTGEPDREVITLMLDVATAIRAIETGSKLQRLAAGMPDSHTEITNPGQMVTTSDLAAIRAEMEQWEREQYGD